MAAPSFRGRRMEKNWGFIPAITLAMTGTNVIAAGGLAISGAATVLRMIGEYALVPTAGGVFAAGDRALIAIGIGVVTDRAFAVGATALPDPGSSPDFSWLYWASHQIHYHGTPDVYTGEGGSLRRSFDIRSMRKMKSDETLAMVLEYADGSGAPPITAVIGSTRVLVGN